VHYRDAVPAVLVATRNFADRAVRPETPARLRLWTTIVVIVAATLFVTTSALMAQTQRQVRIIGDDAAPQAATASDLYFALSDLDAQVARLVLAGDDDSLAATQIDADLQRLMAGASDPGTTLAVLDDLAVYRERVWQALTTSGDKHGFYTQATNLLHLQLLPGAQRLGEQSRERLDHAYAAKQTTQRWGIAVALGLGVVLVVMVLALQVWMARRFRRTFNPALLIATILTVALAGPARDRRPAPGHGRLAGAAAMDGLPA
jgi:hypothetical protein